jgi:hypothetical protein
MNSLTRGLAIAVLLSIAQSPIEARSLSKNSYLSHYYLGLAKSCAASSNKSGALYYLKLCSDAIHNARKTSSPTALAADFAVAVKLSGELKR